MKLKKRIAAFGAASVMAVSMMSIGASAEVASSALSTRYFYNYQNAKMEKYVYKIKSNGARHIWGASYSKAKKSGNKIYAYSGAESCYSEVFTYAVIYINDSQKGTSNKVAYYDDTAWTTGQLCTYNGNTKKVGIRARSEHNEQAD